MDTSLQAARYAIVGAGSRAGYYARALRASLPGSASVKAVLDPNRGRAERVARLAGDAGIPIHRPEELEAVIAEHGVTRVIVTSPDWTHADVIARSLRSGADVVTEKPLTIDAEGCRLIGEAVAETGGDVTVAFNYRYSPRNSAMREAIASGAIGAVTAVHFEWALDTDHGADYFRRWHRDKRLSGGLLVHKASHHFDLVNWWIDDTPTRVFASGGLRFYGAENARARGLGPRPARGSVGAHSDDPFVLDMRRHPALREIYLDNEGEDGYIRDRDPFAEGISIEDSLSLVVDYAGGATMTYSLTAYSPWEGYRISVTGTEGRLELDVVERASVVRTPGGVRIVDPSMAEDEHSLAGVRPPGQRLVLQRMWQPAEEIPIEGGGGPHGGGDPRLFRDLFGVEDQADPLGRAASYRDGIHAVSVGIAGNESLRTGEAVRIAELDLYRDAAGISGEQREASRNTRRAER